MYRFQRPFRRVDALMPDPPSVFTMPSNGTYPYRVPAHAIGGAMSGRGFTGW